MALTVPSEAAAGAADQAELDSVDLDVIVGGVAGIGVVSGCAVTPSSNLTLAVAAGEVESLGLRAAVTGGTVTLDTADGTNARFDLVYCTDAGVKSKLTGTPAANPVFPSPAAGSVVLAAVYVRAGVTTINAADIVDKRMIMRAAGILSGIFGDGSDGAATFDGTATPTGTTKSGSNYTATRDLYYTTLTCTGTTTLNMAGYRLFVRDYWAGSGTIRVHRDGNNASGVTGGAAPAGQIFGGGGAGANGASNGTGGNAGSLSVAMGGAGGNGGNAVGLGGTGGGGLGGTVSAPTASQGGPVRNLVPAISGRLGSNLVGGGSGGGGGSGAVIGTGGGGGSGAGSVMVAVREFRHTGAVTLGAKGGNGANAVLADGGGGGGGGGGFVVMIHGSLTSTGTVTSDVAGGTGGTPLGTGNNGAGGAVGTVLTLVI